MATVTIIPPKDAAPDILRVAAYCRVSSDSADQLHSYAAQIKNYTDLIRQHDGWELVDIYADAGLTGTRMDKREDFNRMLSDCRKGRIDKILVKSISRFARNTKDCLATLRELSALDVTVHFEKENIDTGTLTTELMVSVSGALAQQESMSISQNQRMSYKRRMERGEFITASAPFGYRLVNGKNLEIVPEEAQWIRWMFHVYLEGRSADWIASELEKKKVRIYPSQKTWNPQTVTKMLRNEKYMGDTLCQKTYTSNTLPFVRMENKGQEEQYYTENTHPAIISRNTFKRVQHLIRRRAERDKQSCRMYPLSRKIYCGNCGALFSRKVSSKGYVTWSCRKHERRAADCPVGRIPESELYAAFVRMYHKLHLHAGLILSPALHQLNVLEDALHQKNPAMLEINRAIAQTAEQNCKIAKLQASGLIDIDACAAKQNALDAQLTRLRAQRQMLLKSYDIDDRLEAIRQTVSAIQKGPEQLDSFDETLFETLVEQITAESKTTIRFRLYGGIELTEQLQESKRWSIEKSSMAIKSKTVRSLYILQRQ